MVDVVGRVGIGVAVQGDHVINSCSPHSNIAARLRANGKRTAQRTAKPKINDPQTCGADSTVVQFSLCSIVRSLTAGGGTVAVGA